MTRPVKTVADRYNHLEIQIGNIGTQLVDVLKSQESQAERHEIESNRIWKAIEEQSKNLQLAVEKWNTKGQISWPLVLGFVGMVISVSSAIAWISSALLDAKLETLKISDEFNRRERLAMNETIEYRVEDAKRIALETHQSLKDHLSQTTIQK